MNPEFQHIAGKDNPVADMPSRDSYEDEEDMVVEGDIVGIKGRIQSRMVYKISFGAWVERQ